MQKKKLKKKKKNFFDPLSFHSPVEKRSKRKPLHRNSRPFPPLFPNPLSAILLAQHKRDPLLVLSAILDREKAEISPCIRPGF